MHRPAAPAPLIYKRPKKAAKAKLAKKPKKGRKPTADGCEVSYDFEKDCYKTDEKPPRYWAGSKQLGGQGWATKPPTSEMRRAVVKTDRAAGNRKGRKPTADGCEVSYDFEKGCYKTDEKPPRYWAGSKQLGGQGWATKPPK